VFASMTGVFSTRIHVVAQRFQARFGAIQARKYRIQEDTQLTPIARLLTPNLLTS
jgi:hypothetical protein